MQKLFLPILIVLLLALAACGGDPAEIVSEVATRGGDVAATAAAVATDVADGPDSEGETEVVEPTEEPTEEPTPEPTEEPIEGPTGETFDGDPTQPIAVADENGTEVSIEANTLVDENGNPPAGEVEVNVYTPDPVEEAEAAACEEPDAPEVLTVWSYDVTTGLWVEEGQSSFDQETGSYGPAEETATQETTCDDSVASVSTKVTDEAGNEYGLAEGETAEVSAPCQPQPDEILTVWSYDETTGLWIEEGVASVEDETCTAEVSNLSNVNFVAQDPLTGTLTGQVVNATNNQPLTTAQVCLQDTDQCTSVDDSGNFTFANLPVGEQTVAVTVSGYLDSSSTATVIAEETVQQVVALSPELAEGEVRIILTWPTNTDMDSFLRIPNIDNLISYNNRGSLSAEPFANLDTDSFGFGPETITISQLKAGTYEYWVGLQASPSFAGAQVKVFDSTGLVAEFDGPTDEGPTLPWHVLDIDGATGSIISVNALETFE